MVKLDSSEDLPREYPYGLAKGTEHWSESYAFWALDPNVGKIYWHFQRHPERLELWRGYVTVTRPDGTVFASHNTVGRARSPEGPGFEGCYAVCERPFESWKVCYEGAALSAPLDDLKRSQISDGLSVPLMIDLEFTANAPAWAAHAKTKLDITFAAHYQQAGTISGTIEIGNEKFSLDCLGYRDHSYGPRQTADLTGGCFLACAFPTKGAIGVFQVGVPPQEVRQAGYIATPDGKIHEIQSCTLPEIAAPSESQKGTLSIVAGEHTVALGYEIIERQAVPLSMIPANFEAIGLQRGTKTGRYYFDCLARVEWEGEIGYAAWEPAFRGS